MQPKQNKCNAILNNPISISTVCSRLAHTRTEGTVGIIYSDTGHSTRNQFEMESYPFRRELDLQ
jgi:hypothetical protein